MIIFSKISAFEFCAEKQKPALSVSAGPLNPRLDYLDAEAATTPTSGLGIGIFNTELTAIGIFHVIYNSTL